MDVRRSEKKNSRKISCHTIVLVVDRNVHITNFFTNSLLHVFFCCGPFPLNSSSFITVTMTSDIPRPLEIHVKSTMPGFYSLGWSAYDAQVDDICESGKLSPPSGDDAGYYCPQAGTYNFHFMYDLFGDQNSWVSHFILFF